MINEDQLNINSTEAKLLFDIRSEIRTTNELLAKQLEALRAIAKHTEPKVVEKKELKPKTAKLKNKSKTDKPKRGNQNA